MRDLYAGAVLHNNIEVQSASPWHCQKRNRQTEIAVRIHARFGGPDEVSDFRRKDAVVLYLILLSQEGGWRPQRLDKKNKHGGKDEREREV
ncbi:hypothetical protein HUU39_23610 [candidate division KSB1 bacterium]|nr:hypothetical protein [bacterium]NUM68220.1 hypothetical protein [candidate division KSB1 bacterium]